MFVRSLRLSCRRSNTRRWPNVGLLLAHRLWRWANISPVLGSCIVFDATLNVGQSHRRWANINPALVQSIVTVPPICMYLLYVCGLWSSRQARSVRPVLVQCWPTVCGAGWRCTGQCNDDGGYCSVDMTHWPSLDLVPGRLRRRWTGIESALGLCLSFAGWSDDEKI